jgi:hypothetical protein
LILDPNGDFRKISNIDANYGFQIKSALKSIMLQLAKKLTLENKDEFAKKWSHVIEDFVLCGFGGH